MYEKFFSLGANPFLLNPDPAFLFESSGHGSAFAHLKFGVYQGEGFIVITGEIGAGKTTLVRALLQQLDPVRVVAAQLVSTQLEATDLLLSVAAAFGIPTKGVSKAGLLASLEAFLTSLVPQHRRALLIVDEAQNLSAQALEELRMLSNFQIGTRTLLQSFLVGQPELRQVLRAPAMQQLRQRIVSSYHLGPLAPAETRCYIEHRLRKVGWAGDPHFADPVFEAVHAASGGIPRQINAICNRLLLGALLSGSHAINEADLGQVLLEMRDELGALPPPADRRTVLQPTHDDRLGAAAAMRPFAYASLTARLDRLEKSVNTVIELLQDQAVTDKRGKVAARIIRNRAG